VLTDVAPDSPVIREETFGPTLPIVTGADADVAVRHPHDSQYGLSASVWSKDVERGEQVARRIEAGAVCVNDAQINYYALELPMGGWKQSGLGVRHGKQGIRKYTRQQAVLVTRFAPFKKEIHQVPYRPATTKLLARGLRALYGRGPKG
jgi:acyl-CoA reductase-like NAD-dependent aldehyde dehydrogenase